MAYAKSSLIQDIRHLIDDSPWEDTSTTTTTSATVAVPDGTKWSVGDVGEWSFTGTVGGEQFLVQSISSNNLTTERGYNGTTAETHTSGDRIVKNPRYTVIQITDAIDRVIDAAYPVAYTSATSTVTPDTTSTWFDSGLSGTDLTGFIGLIAGAQVYGSNSDKIGNYGPRTPYVPSRPIVVVRDAPTSIASSGVAIRFPGGFFTTSNDITLTWAVRLTSTVSGGNYSDIDEGLLSEAVATGAIARLVSAKEIPNVSEDTRLGQADLGAFNNTGQWFELRARELWAQVNKDLRNRIPLLKDQNYVPGWW